MWLKQRKGTIDDEDGGEEGLDNYYDALKDDDRKEMINEEEYIRKRFDMKILED